MVERLSIKKAVRDHKQWVLFPSSTWIEAGSALTTVDHSDMRGLVTA
mgnify:CR=1 FL=1